MLHIDDPLRLDGFRALLARDEAPEPDASDPIQRWLFVLLGWVRAPYAQMSRAWSHLWSRPALRRELRELWLKLEADPGNADGVITVGSTHRMMPHNYGVSYFSSRGPTGDGRTKPDLVAPGERIDSCSLNNYVETMDGTSMAAPHVSGAAALLMSRHRELIGQPRRIKEILCRTATDLGRERRFQGAGMVDVLRALQAV